MLVAEESVAWAENYVACFLDCIVDAVTHHSGIQTVAAIVDAMTIVAAVAMAPGCSVEECSPTEA